MFEPSGAACSTSTSAPRARSAKGAARNAAPFPQSTTTCRPSRRRPWSDSDEVRDVVVERVPVLGTSTPTPVPFGPASGITVASVRQLVLDARSIGVGELAPARGEELDAVVLERVVARRDHRRRGAALAREVRDAGRREHAGEDDVGTFGADARDQRGLDHRAGSAGVAADDERASAPRTRDRGATERGDELDGELARWRHRGRRRCRNAESW